MKLAKKMMCLVLAMALTVAMPVTPASAAKKKAPKLNKKKLTLTVGKTAKLKVKNTKKKIKWSSSKKSVATVNKKGKVTAKKAGKTTITAKVGKKKLKCKITVTPKKVKNTATPSPTSTVKPDTDNSVPKVTPTVAPTVKPEVENTPATATPIPTGIPTATPTATPVDNSLKIVSMEIKDSFLVQITLNKEQELTKENFVVKMKRFQNGKYNNILDISSIRTGDQKTYSIGLDSNTSEFSVGEYVQVTITGLEETISAESIYTEMEDKTEDLQFSVNIEDELDNITVNGKGYCTILSKTLPEGISCKYSNVESCIQFTGTFSTAGVREGTVVVEDELGNKYTNNIVWIVGGEEGIALYVPPMYAMTKENQEVPVSASYQAMGGSGSYSFSVLDDEYKDIVSIEDGYVSGSFPSGTHNINIKITDTEDETITSTFTWKVDIKTGRTISVKIKDAKGNIIEDAETSLCFLNKNYDDLYCSSISYSVCGEETIALMDGTYQFEIFIGNYNCILQNFEVSSETTTLEYTLPVYNVVLSSTLDISGVQWYESTDSDNYVVGDIFYLKNGTYTLTGKLIEGMKEYILQTEITIDGENTTANVTIEEENNRILGALTFETSQEVTLKDDFVYYSFTPEESGTYAFYSSGEDDIDTYGELLDEEYNLLSEADDTETSRHFELTYDLEAGNTYYIGIRCYGKDHIGRTVELSSYGIG